MRLVASLGALALTVSTMAAASLVATSDPASAAPGTPGTPQAPAVAFQENFENGVGNAPVGLAAYTGASGQQYTADASWLSNCNGQVRNFNTPYTTLGNCVSTASTSNINQLAYALGAHTGSATPATNHAVTAYTENNPGVNATEFQTAANIPLASSSGRFLTFSVDTAAVNCPPTASAPLYQFAFLNQAGAATNVGGQLDACTSTKTVNVPANGTVGARPIKVGTYTSNGSVLFNGSTLGVRMQNANGSGGGNDAAFDNIRILDVTPQLDKAFSPTAIYAGQTSTLTFTVTNTSELAAKNGWSFTDTLPAGLTLASPTAAASTCPAGVVTAAAGGTTVGVTGNLSAGMTSCTVTVNVTAAAAGTYTNGPGNVTETGLNPPGDSTLTVTTPPVWTCSAFGYLFQTPNAATHQIIKVDLATGANSVSGSTPDNVNAVGYNTLDNFVYGFAITGPYAGHLIKITADGTEIDLGLPAGISGSAGFNVGDVDDQGHLWVTTSAFDAPWFEIDVAPGSATYGQVLSSGTRSTPAGWSTIGSDWTFINGTFYSIGLNSATGANALMAFSPTTHTSTVVGPIAGVTNLTVGATYADASGYLYASDNSTGRIYRIDPTSRATILVANGPVSGGNDGARCADAPIPTITVVKDVDGRVQPADQFTVGLKNAGGAALTSATTTGTNTTASTTNWPVSQGATYTITDAMAAGSPDALSSYAATVACVDGQGNAATTGGTTAAWTLNVAAATAYTCTVTNAPNTPAYEVTKTADKTEVKPGDKLTYTVTVKNTGTVPYTAANPATITDDLSKVVDDATYNRDAAVSYSAGSTSAAPTLTGSTLSWAGPLAVGETATITYSVTVNTPDAGDHVLTNAVNPGDGGSCVPAGSCTTTTPVKSFSVTKKADKTDVIPGETITYTVTVKNTGEVDYTAAAPASFTDDLSAVLDDAVYNNDATSGAAYAAPTLSWSGALAAGDTVTITYSVTVNSPDTGDAHLDNSVVTPPEGGCPAGSGDADCTVLIPQGSYTASKIASTTAVTEGSTVTYTLTVKNTGSRDYTAQFPATVRDDLSQVLDDVTVTTGPDNGATVTGNTLTWSGPLAVGQTVVITYVVTVNTPDTGDKVLKNTVTVPGPGGSCDPAGACTTTTNVRSFSVSKSSSPQGEVHPGDTVTYTVTVKNTGTAILGAANPASFTDDLSAVLDDATYNNDATGGATYAAPTLSWQGVLAVGATKTVTYTVRVNQPDTGDHKLDNGVVPGAGGSCVTGECATSNPVQSYTIAKVSSATGPVHQGDTVTYTVTVTNTGAAEYTAAAPVSISDDLSKVLDDATYVAGSATAGAVVNGNTLTWSGPLAVGAVQTITYQVLAGPPGSGDGTLTNSVVGDPGNGGSCDPAGSCTTTNPLQAMKVTKTADKTDVVPGETVTYTITVNNAGAADYTATDPASFTDDLSAVLDDATYNNDATGGATYAAPTLSWSGALAVGDTVAITYSVTINDPITGDQQLGNTVVTPPGIGGDCPTGTDNAACTVNIPSGSYTVAKEASSQTVTPGGTITYTVTVKNTGKVDYTTAAPASFRDDLTNVLDDAVYNGDASNGATVTGNTLNWAGPLAAGQTVKVTYSVTVNKPDTGNLHLVNAVVPNGPGGACDTSGSCLTDTPVASYTVTKTVSTTKAVKPGAVVGYTITVTNTGQSAYTAGTPASFKDDMTDVLDDATYNNDATHGATLNGKVLSWAGPLGVGETITVTYSVTVDNPTNGNRRLVNTVDPAVDGGSCDPSGSCDTNTAIDPPAPGTGLAFTGSDIVAPGILALILVGAGAAFLVIRRRRTAE